jgi:hypothetical protein
MGRRAFRRIGMFLIQPPLGFLKTGTGYLRSPSEDHEEFRQYLDSTKARAASIDPEFYVRREEEGNCVIRLV